MITDDDGRITAVDDTFVGWTGHSRPNLLGQKLQSLMPAGDQILYSTHCVPHLIITGAASEIAVDSNDADVAGRRGVRRHRRHNHYDWQLKMSDTADWSRNNHDGHRQTAAAVTDLIWMRRGHPGHPALHGMKRPRKTRGRLLALVCK